VASAPALRSDRSAEVGLTAGVVVGLGDTTRMPRLSEGSSPVGGQETSFVFARGESPWVSLSLVRLCPSQQGAL
jgi:hypothetical protein